MTKDNVRPRTGILGEAWANSDLQAVRAVRAEAAVLVLAANKNRRQERRCTEENARHRLNGGRSRDPVFVPENVDWAEEQTAALAKRADALGLISLASLRAASSSTDWREVAPHIKKQAARAIRGIENPHKHCPPARPLYGVFAHNLV